MSNIYAETFQSIQRVVQVLVICRTINELRNNFSRISYNNQTFNQ